MEVRQVRWTEPARDDLGQIYDYIAKQSPITADRVITQIVVKTDLLVTHPFIGNNFIYKGVKLRQLTVKNYRVIYFLTADIAFVIAVVHGARDLRNLLKRRLP